MGGWRKGRMKGRVGNKIKSRGKKDNQRTGGEKRRRREPRKPQER